MNNHVAVVGAGAWGQHHVRTFAHLGALGAVCDPRSDQLERYRQKYPGVELVSSFQRILDNASISAVVIATPAETHFSLASAAIEAGKDVLVEKPMALRCDEGQALLTLAERKQRILMVGHLLQYHPAVLHLKQLLDEGILGKVQYVYSNRLNIGKIRSEENILWSFAPHDISVTLMLLGESPISVSAHGGNYVHHQRADVTMTTLTFASGVKGHIFVSWLHPHKEQRFVVVGDRGMIVFDDLEPTDKLRLYAHQVDWIDRRPVARKAEPTLIQVDQQEPLQLECEHFLKCIAERRTPRTDAREGLAVLSVLEACQRSLDQDAAPVVVSNVPVAAAPSAVHPSAVVDHGCEIGEGTKIWHFSHILSGSTIGRNCSLGQNVVVGPNVRIGDRVKIQNNVSIYQGVTLEDEVFCGPSMVFTNVTNPRSGIARMHELKPTLVQRGASIGANATIVCGHTIGAYSFVGAGSVVTKDVPELALVVGNPARIIGWMCECGVRLRFDGNTAICAACAKTYGKEAGRVRQVVPAG